MREVARASWLVLCTLFSYGCAPAVVKSFRDGPVAIEGQPTGSGFVYYLPKRLIKVQVDRAPAPTPKEVDRAKADVAGAEEAEKKAKETAEAAVKRRDEVGRGSGGTTSAGYLEQAKAAELAQADHRMATEATAKAKDVLLAMVAMSGFPSNDGKAPLVDKLTVTLTAPVADIDERFAAVGNHIVSRSDSLILKTNTAGLLTNTDATSEDQTASIIVSLAGAIAAGTASPLRSFIDLDPAPPVVSKTRDLCGAGYGNPPSELSPFSVEYVLDPLDPKGGISLEDGLPKGKRRHFESLLCALGAPYRFTLTRLSTPKATDAAALEEADGLYYRREVPYLLSIYRTEGDQSRLAKAILLALPNGSPREFLPLKGGAFTTRTFATVFENGMLVSHSEARPSELLAIAKIPVDVLKAIFTIPTELVTLKVNYTNAGKDLAEAQKAILDAARALEEAKNQP